MDESWFDLPVYDLPADDKQAKLCATLAELSAYHQQACQPYSNLLQAYGQADQSLNNREDFFPLAVRLFKYHDLASVPASDVVKTLYSSGTSGNPSTIRLDKATATAQTKVLVRIIQQWLGKKRLPMLIADHPGVVKNQQAMTARGAGIQGLSFLGRNHTYALNEDMTLNGEAVRAFIEKHAQEKVLIFGFTFMVWQYFFKAIQQEGLTFKDAFLLHGGGWKKLQSEAVSAEYFKLQMNRIGIDSVHSYYGMVEQVGSIYVECEHGYLHSPVYSDVVVRDLETGRPCEIGKTGVIELLSVVPESYPGHVLLTEDMGVLQGEDSCPCGRKGRYFTVTGRIPQAETRGCSDTFSREVSS